MMIKHNNVPQRINENNKIEKDKGRALLITNDDDEKITRFKMILQAPTCLVVLMLLRSA